MDIWSHFLSGGGLALNIGYHEYSVTSILQTGPDSEATLGACV